MVLNVHSRQYMASVEKLGACLETLSDAQDALWPCENWPPMVLSDGLNIGSSGGHGPVRYRVEAHEPLRMVRFRFTGPPGWDGVHSFQIEATESGGAKLTHVIDMKVSIAARLSWVFVFRPMHDALLEDALEKVAQALDPTALQNPRHSAWVRFLRRALASLLRAKKK